jgi:hypothetical protein
VSLDQFLAAAGRSGAIGEATIKKSISMFALGSLSLMTTLCFKGFSDHARPGVPRPTAFVGLGWDVAITRIPVNSRLNPPGSLKHQIF